MKRFLSAKQQTYFVVLLIVATSLLAGMIAPWLAILILPGILYLFCPASENDTVIEKLGHVLGLSLGFWVATFPLLKFIPISFTNTFAILSTTTLVATLALVIVRHKQPTESHSHQANYISILFFLGLCIFFGSIFFMQTVPGGADMTTHSYIARVIMESNGFPASFEPIVPIKHFGFSPVGMPSLMALFSTLSFMPLERTALLFAVSTYPLLGLGIFVFLRKFFKPTTALLSVFILFFIGKDVTSYLHWGAIPTVFSIFFLFLFLTHLVSIHQQKTSNITQVIWMTILLQASFTTHQIPALALGYMLFPAISYFFVQNLKKINYQLLALFIIFNVILLLPFVTSIKPISTDTVGFLKGWQQNHELLSLKGGWQTALIQVPILIENKIGKELFLIFILSLIVSAVRMKQPIDRWIIAAVGMYFLLLLNSKYWLLPFSSVLYPDRVTTVASILFAFLTARLIEFCFDFCKLHLTIQKKRPLFVWLSVAPFFCYSLYASANTAYINAEFMIVQSKINASVTANDMAAFNWLRTNTTSNDVIENNYGDAGIWIPAIAARTITSNDAMPHDFDELRAAQLLLKPTYVFIGEKQVYPEHIHLTLGSISENQQYLRVFSSGGSHIFKKK